MTVHRSGGDVASRRRATLGDFLRARRHRRSPADAGLPAGPRRRTAGLRREEVALLAQVSPTYYAYLEQGRDITPSAGVLEGLVRALALTDVERRYVLALVTVVPDTRSVPVALPEAERNLVQELVTATDGSGCPVYVLDGNGLVIAGNRHLEDWYGLSADADGPTNFVRWFFGPTARERLADWETAARVLVSRVRYHAASPWMGKSGLAMLDDLHASDPDFARLWDRHDVADQESATRRFRRPGGTEVTLRIVPVRPAPSPTVSMLVHLPDDTG